MYVPKGIGEMGVEREEEKRMKRRGEALKGGSGISSSLVRGESVRWNANRGAERWGTNF